MFGAKKQSPAKKTLQKALTADVNMLKAFGESPTKQSPLKMRLFEAHESPQKTVADLIMKVPITTNNLFNVKEAEPTLPAPVALPLKANNLLKSRKTCERK